MEVKKWMLSPDRDKRDAKTAKQLFGTQLFGMLKAIDDEEDMHSLLDLALVRNVFLKSQVVTKKYKVGTIKSYLKSLHHFFSSLLSDKPDEVDFNAHDIKAAQEKVQLWSRATEKTQKQKLEEGFQNRLIVANITKFEKSEAARNAIKKLSRHSDVEEKRVVTQSLYTLVRDFLFNYHTHCNAEHAKTEECKYLYSTFTKDSYPVHFINKVLIKQKNKSTTSNEHNKPTTETQVRVSLPYI